MTTDLAAEAVTWTLCRDEHGAPGLMCVRSKGHPGSHVGVEPGGSRVWADRDDPPAEVVIRLHRRDIASRYRRDIADNPARDELWTAYRHGAEWFGADWQTGDDHEANRLGLDDAERAVPFTPSP